MNRLITCDNLKQFAFTNEGFLSGPIKAIVLEFHGLGFGQMIKEPSPFAITCAELRILYVFPYYGPWGWMNDTAVRYTDEVIRTVLEKHRLKADIPIISTGGSMGGLSALIYSRYAEITPSACAANCPVCDLPFHFTERDDLPRTLYSAFSHYSCEFKEALESASPLHQVETMPDIPYYIVHGDADKSVNKQRHSDIFVEKMKHQHSIIYDQVPGMGHCDLKDDALSRYWNFIFSFSK